MESWLGYAQSIRCESWPCTWYECCDDKTCEELGQILTLDSKAKVLSDVLSIGLENKLESSAKSSLATSEIAKASSEEDLPTWRVRVCSSTLVSMKTKRSKLPGSTTTKTAKFGSWGWFLKKFDSILVKLISDDSQALFRFISKLSFQATSCDVTTIEKSWGSGAWSACKAYYCTRKSCATSMWSS